MSSGPLSLPVRFGRYELVDHIATGGMAEVFLARSFGVQGFQKHVVIKRLRPGLAQNPRMVQLFVQEARISAGLVHPNIAQIHELGTVRDGPVDSHYIAMEYVHGQDLTRVRRALHEQGRTLPVDLALYCAVRVLRALAYAHERADAHGRPLGLVHRDVSPHNVLVSFQGEVKLVDFGIARLEGDVVQSQLPGGGKYAYMSPEQASGLPLDGRSDVFSAGILLWELLVGHRLFQHPDPDEKLRRVKAAEVPDPGLERPDLPPEIWPVLRRMLAREPGQRPRAAEAADQLQALSFELGLRGEAGRLGAQLAELFPELARRDPGGLDLDGLVADLARLADPGALGGAPAVGTSDDLTGSFTGSGRSLTGTGDSSTAPGDGFDDDGTLTSLPALRRLAPGERKAVVVVSAEVTGLSELSLVEEPEVIGRTRYRLLRRVRRIVDRHGGWLDRFQDDVLVIFFGVPRATEHDLDRALACAAQLVRTVRALRRRGLPLHLSLGVHSGEISVGRMDGRVGRRLRYLARGDTTSLAGRLCRQAGLDEVLVSERVADGARGRFRFEEGPAIPRRGGGEDPSFRLLGRDTGVRASAGRWLARGDELDRLGRALRRVAAGERVVVAISGPAGAGKSRLVQELRDLARSRGLPVYAARAVPYTVDRPLATLRDLMARVLGVPGDGGEASLEAALARLRGMGLDAADVAVIASMLGLDRPSEAGHDRLFTAAGRVVRRLAHRGPVLLVIDDAQHLSALEQKIVDHVITSTTGVPLLVLLTVRGDVPSGLWSVEDTITLGALEPDVQADLVAHLLGARSLDPDLLAFVQRRAEGNPRYVEAVVHALHNAGGIEIRRGVARLRAGQPPPELPAGLEGLIAARIDALQGVERQALQVAAVIGRTFSTSLLAEAVGADALQPALGRLRAAGLLACEGGTCRFTSDLVYEAALRGMLAARRAELHGLVAEALERRAPRDPQTLVQLAEHLAAAGRPLDAARQADRAGDIWRQRQVLPGAVRAWRRGVEWLVDAQRSGASIAACLSGEAVLRGKLGEALLLSGEAEAAERHLQAGLDAANECEDVELEARALLALGRLLRTRGEPARARVHLEQGRELAAAGEGEPGGWRREVMVAVLEGLGQLAHDAGDAREAARCFEQALDLAGDDDALAAGALLGLAAGHIRNGAEEAALHYLDEARRRAEAAGDRILLGRITNNIGLVHHGAGRYRQALACFQEARALRRDTGYRQGEAINLHNIGDTWLRLGQPGRAWASFERSRDLAASIGWAQGVALNDLWMAWLDAERSGAGVDRIADAGDRARALGDLDTAITARWLQGRLLGRRGRRQQARQVLQQALAEARQLGAGVLSRDIAAALEQLQGGGTAPGPAGGPGI